MDSRMKSRPFQARTLFLSDIHLGFKRARVRELLDFLRGVEAECIVLVGDIVDALSLAKRFFWTDDHTQVLRLLLARRRAGARLVYLPGNHDASLAMLAEMLHGQLEEAMSCPPWLYWVADRAYEATLAFNHRLNDLRRHCGWPYLPLVERMKLTLGASSRYIARFERIA